MIVLVTENNIYQVVSKNIKKYRKLKGMTQNELASKCGYSYAYIRRIEAPNCAKDFSLQTIYNISLALNIPLENLLENNNIYYNMKLVNIMGNYLNDNNCEIIIQKNKININNYQEILDFSPQKIIVRCEEKIYTIEGADLTIAKMIDNELLIIGDMKDIFIKKT